MQRLANMTHVQAEVAGVPLCKQNLAARHIGVGSGFRPFSVSCLLVFVCWFLFVCFVECFWFCLFVVLLFWFVSVLLLLFVCF